MLQLMGPAITPQTIGSLFALAIGFAVAGACASAYRVVWQRFPSFHLLAMGPMPARFAAVPLLVFSAPFIIMRNTLQGRQFERRRVGVVMMATIIAGLWSLMCGAVVMTAFQALINV